MSSLSDYLNKPLWDCHIHLAGGDIPRISKNCVILANWLPEDDPQISLYDIVRKAQSIDNDIVLLNGNPDEIEKILKDNTFKGIGEINVKKTYTDSNNSIKTWEGFDILDKVLKDPRPIYIHWDLESEDASQLESILRRYPNKKFNLCHLGYNHILNNENAIDLFKVLQKKNQNLWGDISWDTLDLIMNMPDHLNGMDKNRILVGSDLCRLLPDYNPYDDGVLEKRRRQVKSLENTIDVNSNVYRFFQ